MSDGQAGDSPGTIDDLAQFLVDTPDVDSDPTLEDDDQPSDEPLEDTSEEQTEDAPADEDEPSEDAEKPTSDLKFKVPVKGEDGTETIVEVDQKELIAGYQRHSDYTKKTMELGEREREVTQAVAKKLHEGHNYYMQQAQIAQAAVKQLAGFRTPEEMAILAQTDQATWVSEKQRMDAVNGVLQQLDQGMKTHDQQRLAFERQQNAEEAARAWGVLGQKGIDKPKLVKIYEVIHDKYKVAPEKLGSVMDPALVEIMRDAAAYQELKDKKATVVKKATEAPKLPASRQPVPKNEQRNKQINQKFSQGKAKLRDLAAWIENN